MKPTSRRTFLRQSSGIVVGLGAGLPLSVKLQGRTDPAAVNARQYLQEILYSTADVDDWLAGRAFPFSKYHAKYGWLLNNARFRDGVDNSYSTYTYLGEDGARLMGNYRDSPCRINTYGNSFTQCHQVSDHETWQEILAAHLQEPVRNFGVGGWSVYQSYLRMLDEEQRNPADCIIFNIYEDDHKRNLDAWRNIRVRKHPQHIEAPLPHISINLNEKSFAEHENPCPTEEALYDLCDLEKSLNLFADDFVLKIMLAHRNAESQNPAAGYTDFMTLARTHGINTRVDDSLTLEREADRIHQEAALFSSLQLLDKLRDYIDSHQKKILFVLSYSPKSIAQYLETGDRFDRRFIDALDRYNLPYADLLAAHIDDFKKYRIDVKTYLDQYFIGHYNPRGNHFCAFAMKDALVRLLEPKPLAYRA